MEELTHDEIALLRFYIEKPLEPTDRLNQHIKLIELQINEKQEQSPASIPHIKYFDYYIIIAMKKTLLHNLKHL